MTTREVRFRLFFKTGVYVSTLEGPDILKVTFRDPYLFFGVNDLSIGGPSQQQSSRMLSKEADDSEGEGEFLVLTKQIPS